MAARILSFVILSRRSRGARSATGAGRRRNSRCATPAETLGFKRSLGSLRSFGVLRRLCLRLRASGSLRMTTAPSLKQLRLRRLCAAAEGVDQRLAEEGFLPVAHRGDAVEIGRLLRLRL